MDKETKPGYEPNRIPASVFASSITPKQDWSIQSNESLFSIHMGDHSFSTMYKSGELTNFEYTASYINNYTNNNNNNIDNKITSTDAGSRSETVPKTKPKPDPQQQIPSSPAKSYRSDTSNNSAASFAFPTLPEYKQDRKKSLHMKSESGKTEVSSRPGSKHDNSKPSGGGWLSCFFCFPVKN
ncbi:hypothetical protein CARUB_v10006833mg [Capsella rubella]|uniref:Uncharacterized protein n=1 Tax=Capsella rubella TaxID=81985 RepID=R0H457_9BRAS|nr:myb-like protein Q [Capsella rubella]EOA18318.1 hypothetical protein CARUB_v10006833mg [Capsella rubella]